MGRGRKVCEYSKEQAQLAFINAAASLLNEKPYTDISLRELAALAGQNVAMVAYYFGSKEALFVELIKRNLQQSQRKDLIESASSSLPIDPCAHIKQLIRRFITLHKQHPWLARFIVDNVISNDGPLRKTFVSEVIEQNAESLAHAVRALIQSSASQSLINPEYLRVSIISMIAFPFVAQALLTEAFDFDVHHINTEEWVEHNYRLIMTGCGAHACVLKKE